MGVKRANEATYEVVCPLGKSTARPISFASPLSDLKGKTIGFVWNIFTNGDVLAESLAKLLGQRFAQMHFVKLASCKGGKWGDYPQKDFSDVVKEAGVDAVIALAGG